MDGATSERLTLDRLRESLENRNMADIVEFLSDIDAVMLDAVRTHGVSRIVAPERVDQWVRVQLLVRGLVQHLVDGVYESGDRPHNIVLIDALEAADAVLAKLRGDANAT